MRSPLLAGAAALAITALPVTLSAQAGGQPDARTEAQPERPSTVGSPGQQRAQPAGQGDAKPAPRTSAQANARPVPPATTTVRTTSTGRTVITSDNPGNLTPPPPSVLNKTYPPCTRTLQDNCRNPGEG